MQSLHQIFLLADVVSAFASSVICPIIAVKSLIVSLESLDGSQHHDKVDGSFARVVDEDEATGS
jgi:hypothetical protein